MSSGRGRGRGYTPESHRDNQSPLRRPPVISTSSGSSLQQSPSRSVEVVSGGLAAPDENSALRSSASDGELHSRDTICSTKSTSTLNANAVEFIPRTPDMNLPNVSAESSLSAEATEFVPGTGTAVLEVNVLDQVDVNAHAELQNYTYNILDAVLNTPSEFNIVTEGYADYLTTNFSDRKSIEVVCESILGIVNAFDNFSYTCGRLCRHIHENVSNNHEGIFIQHMLATCRKAHEDFKAKTLDRTYLRRFTLFMAELYDIIRIDKILEAILELLEMLLEDINNENAKTICQTLKLRGGSFEDFLQQINSPSMGRLMEKIGTCNTGGLSPHIQKMVADLTGLRASNWGRVSASPVETPTSSVPAGDEPVFYSPAGQIIDRAEAVRLYGSGIVAPSGEFDYSQWSNGDDTEGGASGDWNSVDPDEPDSQGVLEMVEDYGMTDEMSNDYELFTKEPGPVKGCD